MPSNAPLTPQQFFTAALRAALRADVSWPSVLMTEPRARTVSLQPFVTSPTVPLSGFMKRKTKQNQVCCVPCGVSIAVYFLWSCCHIQNKEQSLPLMIRHQDLESRLLAFSGLQRPTLTGSGSGPSRVSTALSGWLLSKGLQRLSISGPLR